jgi:hypothetical protein
MVEDVASAVRQDRLVPNHFDVARAMVTVRRGRRDAWDFLRRFSGAAGRVMIFRVENQAVAHWGVAVEDLRLADPPVIYKPDAPYSAEALQGVRQAIPGDWLIEPAP